MDAFVSLRRALAGVCRQLGRVIGLLVALVILFFLIAESIGDRALPSFGLLASMGAMILGLIVAFRWPVAGALVALAGYAGMGPRAWTTPLLFVPVAAALDALGWLLGRNLPPAPAAPRRRRVVWVVGTLGLLLVAVVGLAVSYRPRPPRANTRTFVSPTNLNGVTVSGPVSFYSATGGIKFATLACDQVAWGKTPLPKGTGVHFTRDGKPDWCFLAKHSEIKGHLMHGGGHGWMTCFYPTGELKSGGLVNIETIDGIPCDIGSFWNEAWGGGGRTYFYEDGRLKSAKVAKTTTYRGQTIKKGRHVALKPDGSIESIK